MNTGIDKIVPLKFEGLYTIEQAAQILQYHPKTVRSMVRTGELPAYRRRNGYRISGWDIARLFGTQLRFEESGNVK